MIVETDPVAVWIARLALAAIFAAAAAAKLRAPGAFVGVVDNYRLLPRRLVRPVAILVPVLEAACAAGLVIPATAPVAAIAGGGLLLAFAAAMAINLRRGNTDIDCGCFANVLKQRLSWLLVGRNLVLVALAVVAGAAAAARPLTWLDGITGVAAVIALAAVYAAVTRIGALAGPRAG